VDPSISEEMNAVTVRLLGKDPEERYPDAASLVKDLDRVGKGLSPTVATRRVIAGPVAQTVGGGRPTAFQETRAGAPSLSAPYRQKKWKRRMVPLVVAAVLFAALALIETMGSGLWQDLLGWSDVPGVKASSVVEVPDVTGQDIEEASQRLRDAGLTVDSEHDTVQSDEPEGTVVNTDPPADSEAEAGTSVTMTVSRGTPKERTSERNAPTGSGTAAVVAATKSNAQQPDPTQVHPPTPAPLSAPQQSDPEQSAENEEQVLEDRREIREEVQEEKGKIQEKGQGRAENAREDRIDD
jgi:hypothetical protein